MNRVDDWVVALLRGTHRLWFAALALAVASAVLGIPPRFAGVVRGGVVLTTALQLAIWGDITVRAAVAARVRDGFVDRSAPTTTLDVVGLAVRGVLYVMLVLLALDNLGVNVGALVAGLGIGGVAVALAVQSILGDLFASLSIALDRPFEVGDFIVVGDLMGSVEHVGLKTTRVRSLSGEQLVFANADLLGSRIRNFKRMSERRVVFTVGVTYETAAEDLARIPGLLRTIVSAERGVRFDRAHLRSCDDSAVTFEIVYYVTDPDYNRYMDIQQAINLAIFRRFEADHISFAYPTRTVVLRRERSGAPVLPVGIAG
jgi:small-conductance mechanosensitive channel